MCVLIWFGEKWRVALNQRAAQTGRNVLFINIRLCLLTYALFEIENLKIFIDFFGNFAYNIDEQENA